MCHPVAGPRTWCAEYHCTDWLYWLGPPRSKSRTRTRAKNICLIHTPPAPTPVAGRAAHKCSMIQTYCNSNARLARQIRVEALAETAWQLVDLYAKSFPEPKAESRAGVRITSPRPEMPPALGPYACQADPTDAAARVAAYRQAKEQPSEGTKPNSTDTNTDQPQKHKGRVARVNQGKSCEMNGAERGLEPPRDCSR